MCFEAECLQISSSFKEDQLDIPVRGSIRIEENRLHHVFYIIVKDSYNFYNYRFIKHKVIKINSNKF